MPRWYTAVMASSTEGQIHEWARRADSCIPKSLARSSGHWVSGIALLDVCKSSLIVLNMSLTLQLFSFIIIVRCLSTTNLITDFLFRLAVLFIVNIILVLDFRHFLSHLRRSLLAFWTDSSYHAGWYLTWRGMFRYPKFYNLGNICVQCLPLTHSERWLKAGWFKRWLLK